jgi:hypothetical protein
MHTVIVVGGGFVLLGVCALVGRMLGGANGVATAALIFLPVWLIAAATNMYVGVSRAGYTVAQETPIFVLVFTVPAVVALFTWWKLR